MRFLRGLLIGILGFFLMIIGGIVAIGATYGIEEDIEIDLGHLFQEAPIWTGLFLIGLLLMFLGPIYYWVIETILSKRKAKEEYNY